MYNLKRISSPENEMKKNCQGNNLAS